MRLLRQAGLIILFYFMGTGLAQAVLQTADVNKPAARKLVVSSKLVSNGEEETAAEDQAAPSAGANAGTIKLRLSAQSRSQQPPSREDLPQNTTQTTADPFALGKSRVTHPQAVKPEPVSPVVQRVSGPAVDLNAYQAKMKSAKPSSASFSFSTKTNS